MAAPAGPLAASDADFAALRETVFDDFHLLRRLRPPAEGEAFVTRVVALGAERGLALDADTVRAAMRAGEQRWLATGAEPT